MKVKPKIIKTNRLVLKELSNENQNDFIDIADVATPVVCDEIEEQMENPEYYEIVVDKK